MYSPFIDNISSKIATDRYLCDKTELTPSKMSRQRSIATNNISSKKIHHEVEESIVQRLNPSNQWVVIFPQECTSQLKYHDQNVKDLLGTRLLEIARN